MVENENLIKSLTKSLNRFVFVVVFFLKKDAYALVVFFNQVPYRQISDMIYGVNMTSRKVSVVSVNRAGGGGGWRGSETPAGGLAGGAP